MQHRIDFEWNSAFSATDAPSEGLCRSEGRPYTLGVEAGYQIRDKRRNNKNYISCRLYLWLETSSLWI
ncbi:hypothetical protein AZA_90051 [Nitrospirillum viridazoti Y2]|nr:hypothetical protein AZA_90051 [Nitrospirillum amazonense Y2]